MSWWSHTSSLLVARSDTSGGRVLRWLVLVIFVAAVVLTASIGVHRARLTESTAATLVTQQAQTARSAVRLFFRPVVAQLVVARSFGKQGFFDATRPETSGHLLIPLLEPLEQVDACTVVTADGRLLIFRWTGSEWERRIETEGTGQLETAAWYRGAKQVDSNDPVYWDDIQRSTVDGGIGITASTAWRNAAGEQTVVAFHIEQESIRRFIDELPIGEAGDVYVFSEDDTIVRLSTELENAFEITSREKLFFETEDRASSNLLALLDGLDSVTEPPPPIRFTHAGTVWWCVLSPIRIRQETVWMGLALPESELLADLRRDVDNLIYVLSGVLALGVLFVVVLAKQYGDRLQAIAKRPKFFQAPEEEVRSLIHGGEQERLELKSTMRWNLKANKAGPEIERAWLKTLVAFLNTDGGTLLIGVRDDGEVTGLEADQFPNEDKVLLHFNNKIKQHVGLEQAALISVAIRSIGDKRILIVDCDPSTDPVFLRNGDQEEFFVRIGSGTRHLPASKVLEYVKKRSPA